MHLEVVARDLDRAPQLLVLNLAMAHDWRWVMQIDKIVFIEVFHGQVAIASASEVDPSKGRSYLGRRRCQVDSLLRLGVQKRVTQQELFTFKI
mmetsp:Transcript_27695/g.36992  ORF Transcript_27695/g.36992 Transcript_27695/m.36992 type:complete len:93 (+) Transcript_27695:2661-2939(+)